jgi:pimeloyl-ACP methyl ester carboxylesterase
MPLYSNARDTFFKVNVTRRGIKKVFMDLVFDRADLDMELLERTLKQIDDLGRGEGITKMAELIGDESLDWKNLIRTARCPVLLASGRNDPLLDEDALERVAGSTSAKLYFIEQCGHFPHIERPDELSRIIGDFSVL